METELRQRKRAQKTKEEEEITKKHEIEEKLNLTGSYWLTRVVFLRALAFIYFVAFAVSFNQNKELIGDHGLLPAKLHLEKMRGHYGQSKTFDELFRYQPTLLWLLEPWEQIDPVLDGIALVGLSISLVVLVTGSANMIGLSMLWLLYHSLVNVGQTWFSFGWESQLLETGFLAIWIVPLFSWKQLPVGNPPGYLAVLGYRWLITRIMIGAGMIKIRGDPCWTSLTCMNYFFETQPNPNPVSFYAHHAPIWWHKFETVGNHMIELVLPFFAFLPFRWAAMLNGSGQILFQLVLISTGNLSFLNWLTILPSIWFFDDAIFSRLFSQKTLQNLEKVVVVKNNKGSTSFVRKTVHICIGSVLAWLSYPIVLNLLSPNQIMNTSFEPFRIVNTYGAFGSVTKDRSEVILEGTTSDNPGDKTAVWLEYEFKCKPGNVTQRPCFISPYHYRLDWLMWFAAFQRYEHNPWLVHLAGKMLHNDPVVDSLLQSNPFKGKSPPKFVRASHYKYKFAGLASADNHHHHWWNRHYWKEYMPPVNIQTVRNIYSQFGWKARKSTYKKAHIK